MSHRFVASLSTAIVAASWVTLAPNTYAQTQSNSVPPQPAGVPSGTGLPAQAGGYPQSQFGVYPQQPSVPTSGEVPPQPGVVPSYPQQPSAQQPGVVPGYPQQPAAQQPVGYPTATPAAPVPTQPTAAPQPAIGYPPPLQPAPVIAQPPSFYCGQSQGYPATLARTPRGDVTVIQWVSDFFSASGWTPETRCQEVSRRFQTFSRSGTLQFVTTGYINRQPVICAAQERYGRCTGLLLTLKPGSNPTATLQRLMNAAAYGSSALHESTVETLYINMKDFLRKAPVNR